MSIAVAFHGRSERVARWSHPLLASSVTSIPELSLTPHSAPSRMFDGEIRRPKNRAAPWAERSNL